MRRIFFPTALAIGASVLSACGSGSSDPARLASAPTAAPSTSLTPTSARRLYVGATGFVAVYDPPFTNASLPSFRIPIPSGTGMATALAVDAAGDLAVLDTFTGLVVYTAPLSSTSQGTVVAPGPASYSQALIGTSTLAFDRHGNLWLTNGPRIVELRAPITTKSTASVIVTTGLSLQTGGVYSVPIAFGGDDILYALDKTTLLAYAPPYSEITPTAVVPLASAAGGGLVIDNAGGAYVTAVRAGAAPGGDSLAQIAYYSGPLASPATSPGSTIAAGGSATIVPTFSANVFTFPGTSGIATPITGLAQDGTGNLFAADGSRGVVSIIASPLTPNSAPAVVLPCPLDVRGQCAIVNSAGGALAFGP